MAQIFVVHPENPQSRLLQQAGELLEKGGLVAVPTDSSYAVVARLDDKGAAENLRRIRGLDERHHLTLLCRDLAEISHFARVENTQYRLLKMATPGPWTFILPATKEVPRRVSHPSRKSIGIRVPANKVTRGLIDAFGSPLLSTTMIPSGEELPLNDAQLIFQHYQHDLAAVIDGGPCPFEPTTVIDMTEENPRVTRLGSGDPKTLGIETD